MTLSEFFVIVPDLSTEKHPEVRPRHLSHVAERMAKGEFYRQGGAYLSSPIASGQEGNLPYAGSAMVVAAEDEEDVKRQLTNDPYAKEGVWDVAKARIFHFKTGDSVPINYPLQQ
ncbi:hypothetical protein L873DRAFT_1809030 [Choiromyces venosus 120613-1]|uniref:YCII-related domain-containing protein n=1 Tax=Choiromyces venosus 120613-1 TaxID=1336337 RepID=A0A3N4JI29_9PEZI|nr:hypothetical protein L873DRAFT_1809030 [Choiromyces venosus 120613-1]